jgi:hypothetical protein
MREAQIYIPLWQKYRPVLVSKMRESIVSNQTYALSKHEFEAIGDRTQSGYSFNLEIKNGIVQNNIDGTAVARDLFEVLKNSKSASELMKDNHFKINLSKDFLLTIQLIPKTNKDD